MKGRFTVPAGRFVKLAQGLCLRTYRPEVKTVSPADGRPSLYVAKDSPAVMRLLARFGAENCTGCHP